MTCWASFFIIYLTFMSIKYCKLIWLFAFRGILFLGFIAYILTIVRQILEFNSIQFKWLWTCKITASFFFFFDAILIY